MMFVTVLPTVGPILGRFELPYGVVNFGSGLKSEKLQMSGRSAAW
jgi:hypothetical protein